MILALIKLQRKNVRKAWRIQIGDSNPDLWSAGVVLHQLSYQANLELVVVWVDDKAVRMMATIYIYDVNYVMVTGLEITPKKVQLCDPRSFLTKREHTQRN